MVTAIGLYFNFFSKSMQIAVKLVIVFFLEEFFEHFCKSGFGSK